MIQELGMGVILMQSFKEICRCGFNKEKHSKKYPYLCDDNENCQGYCLNDYEAGLRKGRKQGALETCRKIQLLIHQDEPETSLERICNYIEKELRS